MSKLNIKLVEIFQTPKTCQLATISVGNKPWTRPMLARLSSTGQIIMATSRSSRKVSDIMANSEVHIALGGDKNLPALYNIQAKANIIDHSEILHRYWDAMLKKYFSGPEDPEYVLISAEVYLIEQFSMEHGKPKIIKD